MVRRGVALPVAKKVLQGDELRACGSCSACCTNLAVAELHKPAGVRCVHLTAAGKCSIYDTRPKGCRDFDCYWRQGAGDMSLRPDRSGAVLANVTNDLSGESVALYVSPDRPERWRRSKYLRNMVDKAVDRGHTVYIIGGTKYRRVITHDKAVAQAARDLMAESAGDDDRVIG